MTRFSLDVLASIILVVAILCDFSKISTLALVILSYLIRVSFDISDLVKQYKNKSFDYKSQSFKICAINIVGAVILCIIVLI